LPRKKPTTLELLDEILVVVDKFSKQTVLIPTKKRQTTECYFRREMAKVDERDRINPKYSTPSTDRWTDGRERSKRYKHTSDITWITISKIGWS
jgi:hypothetical protein